MSGLGTQDHRTAARASAITALALSWTVLVAEPGTQAQPYCARYDSGGRDCGIPTLEMCQQSLRGMNGVCERDITAQLPADLIPPPPRLFPPPELPPPPPLLQPVLPPPAPPQPGDPTWIPPPPGQ